MGRGMLAGGINKRPGKEICEKGGKEIRVQNIQKSRKRRVG
jgi:hypothetical protein